MSIFEMLLGYLLIGIIGGGIILTLIIMGWVLSKTIFPMLGQGIIDLNYKVQKKMRMDGQRNRKWMQDIKEKKADPHFQTWTEIKKQRDDLIK